MIADSSSLEIINYFSTIVFNLRVSLNFLYKLYFLFYSFYYFRVFIFIFPSSITRMYACINHQYHSAMFVFCFPFPARWRKFPSVICHPSSIIRHSPSAIRYPLSAIRYPSFAIRHPFMSLQIYLSSSFYKHPPVVYFKKRIVVQEVLLQCICSYPLNLSYDIWPYPLIRPPRSTRSRR